MAFARPGLLRLRLRNFKSYPGAVDIDLSGDDSANPFVSIVGPNGSGKSNLLDAVAFVIGLSPAEMRCRSFNELVNASAKTNDASVEAVLVDQTFRRSTSDRFWIGGQEVSHDVYVAEWRHLNVSSHCIVPQGTIERIAELSPPDLARLIESLDADIEPLVKEYDTLKADLDTQLAQTRSSHSKRRRVHADVRHFEELAHSRQRYEQLREELQNLEKEHKQLSEQHKEQQNRKLAAERERRSDDLETARQAAQAAQGSQDALQRQFARERRRLAAARTAEHAAIAELAELEVASAPIHARIEAVTQELRLLDPDLQGARDEHRTLADAHAALIRRLDALDGQRASHDTTGFRPELITLASQWAVESAPDQERIAGLRQRARALEQRKLSAEKVQADIEHRRNLLEQAKVEHTRRVKSLETAQEETTQRLDRARTDLQETAEAQREVATTVSDLRTRLRTATDQLKRSDGSKRSEQRRARILDAVARLRREFSGVIDVLSAVVVPRNASDNAALDRMLAPHAESVVVDTVETAVACVERLRSEQLSLTFLPLAQLDARMPPRPSTARLLVDAVECAPRVRPAVLYALGDSVIADSIAEALELRKSVRGAVVVRNGALLSASGLMSGGGVSTTRERTAAGLQRRAHALAEKLKTSIDRGRALQDAEDAASAAMGRYTQLLEAQGASLEEERARVASLDREISHIEGSGDMDTTKNGLHSANELEMALHHVHEALQSLERSLENHERRWFEPLVHELGISIDEVLEKVHELATASEGTGASEVARQRTRIADEASHAADRVEVAQHRVAELQARRGALQSALERSQEELERNVSTMASLASRSSRLQARASELRQIVEDRGDAMRDASNAVEEAQKVVDDLEHRVAMLSEDVAPEQNQSHSLSSPTADSNGKPYDSDQMEADEDEQHVVSKGSESIDDSEVGQNSPEGGDDLLIRLDALNDRIREARDALASVVVARSAESDHDRARDELEVASGHAASQQASTAATRGRLDTVVSQRSRHFKAIQDELQTSLAAVYAELTGGAGQALLTALDAAEPWRDGVAFSAMPPAKQYEPLHALSGGERAVAALALLLAVQRVRPAPFVVLDEVDAALDAANVHYVARYLRDHGHATQFLVGSLKPRLYTRASHLVGVYRADAGSRILTLPLTS